MDRHNNTTQHCICRYSAKPTTTLEHLDITLICVLLQHCVSIPNTEKTWLTNIKKIRNDLAHATSMSCYQEIQLDTWWIDLENCVLGLAAKVPLGHYYFNSIKSNIHSLKKVEVDPSDIKEILDELKLQRRKFQEDMEKISTTLEQERIETRNHICQLEEEVKDLKRIVCDIYSKSDASKTSQRIDTQFVEASCLVTGDNINEELMLRNIQQNEQDDTDSGFNVTSAKRSCIILDLSASSNIFQSTETFRQAIRSLITRIIEAGELDNREPCAIKFDITFNSSLTQDEVGVISSLTTLHYNTDDEQEKQHELGLPSIMCDTVDAIDLKTKIESLQYCTEHVQLTVKYYCPVHDCICCNACIEDMHTSCQEVLNLDVACKDTDKLILEGIGLEINNINKTLSDLEEETKIYISDINAESQNIERKIVQAKATAINQIDETAKRLLSEVQEEKRKNIVEEYQLTAKCKTIAEKLVPRLKVIEYIQEHGTEKQAFILAHHLIPTVDDIGNSVSTIISSTSRIKLAFNTQLDLITYIPKFGSIIKSRQQSQVKYTRIKAKHAQRIVQTADKPLTSFKLTSTFRTSGFVCFTGMIVTDDNTLLLCDKDKVLVYHDNGQYVSTINMKYTPWDITVIPGGDQYVVTLLGIGSIQYINSEDLTLKRCVKLRTANYVYGITADNQYIYVGEFETILVLNHEGNLIRSIMLHNFDYLHYLAVSDNNLYASDAGDNIYCIGKHGVIQKRNIIGTKVIRKIIVDRHGYIYVGGGGSQKVYRLGKELKQTMTIGDDSLQNITAICFNKHCSKLFVASDQGIVTFICS